MTALEIAGLLKDYGPWGLVALFAVVIVKLYGDNQRISTTYIERLITGVDSAAAAAGGVQNALTELRTLMDASGKNLNEHSHQISLLVEKVQHGFGNTSSAMQAVANELQRQRERDDRGRP